VREWSATGLGQSLDSFRQRHIELKDIVYFLSIITLGLFATNARSRHTAGAER